MTTQFALELNDSAIHTLQELVQINIDSAKGFEESADALTNPLLRELCLELASTRWENAQELRAFVQWNEEVAPTDGSYLAAMHRVWMKVRQYFSSNDEFAILSEAEYGEDCIKRAYEDAIEETVGTAVYSTLTRQYLNICDGHDRIKMLRDASK
ncbi:PA2169 family four-helix-bundle protein [bacterium]|nr:PA2169 family four-helix-bundle protein [bacterium]